MGLKGIFGGFWGGLGGFKGDLEEFWGHLGNVGRGLGD